MHILDRVRCPPWFSGGTRGPPRQYNLCLSCSWTGQRRSTLTHRACNFITSSLLTICKFALDPIDVDSCAFLDDSTFPWTFNLLEVFVRVEVEIDLASKHEFLGLLVAGRRGSFHDHFVVHAFWEVFEFEHGLRARLGYRCYLSLFETLRLVVAICLRRRHKRLGTLEDLSTA